MKKVVKIAASMFIATIICILSVFSSYAQSLPEFQKKLRKIETMISLTEIEEKETKEAVLQNNINISNQKNVLKLALKQYISQYKNVKNSNSVSSLNDEWIITQEVEKKSENIFSDTLEQDIVATTFLVLDESGNKVTPSSIIDETYIDLNPVETDGALNSYMLHGSVKYYATAERTMPFFTINRIRVNKIETKAYSVNPSYARIRSFTHYVSAITSIETRYMKEDTITNPVNQRIYTLNTVSMGFHGFQGGLYGDIYVGALFYTTASSNFEVVVRMADIYMEY